MVSDGAERHEDWFHVVYGSGLDGRRSPAPGTATEIAVRQSPGELDPSRAPGGEQRVRITVIPSAPGIGWALHLMDLGRGPGNAPNTRVWWRMEPGTWRPLGGTRQCVATGRGRVRLDVELRVDHGPGEGAVAPRLRFVAESL